MPSLVGIVRRPPTAVEKVFVGITFDTEKLEWRCYAKAKEVMRICLAVLTQQWRVAERRT